MRYAEGRGWITACWCTDMKTRIYHKGRITRNQILIRYPELYGETDFIVTITDGLVALYVSAMERKPYSESVAMAAEMKKSEQGWADVLGDDECFYEFVKRTRKKDCRRLLVKSRRRRQARDRRKRRNDERR